MPEKWILRQYQALPLKAKELMSLNRIREWYDHWDGNVYISFSGGKDSTVLSHLVHQFYPDVPMVFCDTGLEYPEVRRFAKKMGAEVIYPKMRFDEVISKYGYPIISKENSEAIHFARRIRNSEGGGTKQNSENAENNNTEEKGNHEKGIWQNWRRESIAGVGHFKKGTTSLFDKSKWLPLCRDTQFKISHYCCNVMKKSPMHIYQRQHKAFPYLGTMADESRLREQAWIRHGCNAFEGLNKTSQPMSFWTEQDVLRWLYAEGHEIASVYGDIVGIDKDGYEYEPMPGTDCQMKCTGCQRTGCMFCGFGFHLDKGETRFQKLAKTHPKQYEYCLGGGQWVDNPDYDPAAPKMDDYWQNWNPKKIWVPSKKGLGMKKVFDDCNAIYGKDFMRYD